MTADSAAETSVVFQEKRKSTFISVWQSAAHNPREARLRIDRRSVYTWDAADLHKDSSSLSARRILGAVHIQPGASRRRDARSPLRILACEDGRYNKAANWPIPFAQPSKNRSRIYVTPDIARGTTLHNSFRPAVEPEKQGKEPASLNRGNEALIGAFYVLSS